jgi:hypothetical protein
MAQDQLTDLWLNSTNRNLVTRASHQIDHLLSTDPDRQGVAFYGDRLLVVPPLQVVYRIDTDDMQVVIEMIW